MACGPIRHNVENPQCLFVTSIEIGASLAQPLAPQQKLPILFEPPAEGRLAQHPPLLP